jgi:aminoglycoside 6-adenylyltransferase
MNERDLLQGLSDYLAKFDESQLLVLNGSMADPNIPKDQFQDIDLSMFTLDISRTTDRIHQCTLLHDVLLFSETRRETTFAHVSVRLLLESGTEVDFNIYSNKEVFLRKINHFVVPLFNKLNEFMDFAPPTHRPFHVDKPNAEEFHRLFIDINWAVANVLKGVRREQLIYAKHKYDTTLQPKLKKLLVWYIRDQHDWNVSLGSHGKRIKEYVQPEIYNHYLETYSTNCMESIPKTLLRAKSFVADIGTRLADSLGYQFPTDINNKMSRFLGLEHFE